MTVDFRTTLARQRADIVAEIIANAADKAVTRHLLDQLALADRAMASVATPSNFRFATAERHIDAILMYLDEIDTAATPEEIKKGLIAGGYLGGSPEAGTKILKSISNYLTGTGSKTRDYIRNVGDLVGRHEWPDSKFIAR